MINFKIIKIDIFQSYFFGKVENKGKEFSVNIQNQRGGHKVLKLPFGIVPKKHKVLVRFTGPDDIFVEDYLPYCGESEWIEIDSDEITYFMAENQDKMDVLEIMD